MGSPRLVRVVGFLGCTPATVSFLRESGRRSSCPYRERHGDSVAEAWCFGKLHFSSGEDRG